MRNLYRIAVLLGLLVVFFAAFLFVTSNRDLVMLDLLFIQWQVSMGVLSVSLLAIGLLAGLLAGLGLRGIKGLFS